MKNILIAGATGNLGPHLIKEFVKQGNRVSALIRTSSLSDPGKIDPLKEQGVTLIEGDLEDPKSLDRACQGQDVVVSALGAGQIMMQKSLAEAAARAGVKRFIPSEFGVDPHAAGRGTCDLFDAKAAAQTEIKATGIPYTMIYNNGFMEFWGTGLGQLGAMTPPDEVQMYGDGTTDAYMVSLPDIAQYTAAILNDPSTLNREVTIRANKINQNDLISTWENLSGKTVKRIPVSGAKLTEIINASNTPETMMQRVFTQLHRSVWIKGDCNKERSEVLSAVDLYPQIEPLGVTGYFRNFID